MAGQAAELGGFGILVGLVASRRTDEDKDKQKSTEGNYGAALRRVIEVEDRIFRCAIGPYCELPLPPAPRANCHE